MGEDDDYDDGDEVYQNGKYDDHDEDDDHDVRAAS